MIDDDINLEDDIFQPQVSYCCGSRGIIISQAFKKARTRSTFVLQVFSAKLLQLTFIATIVLFAIQWESLSSCVEELYWVTFLTFPCMLILYFCVRCAGAGRRCPWNILLFVVITLSASYTSAGLITFSGISPYAYMVFLYFTTIALMSLGILVITLMFEADVTGKGIYKGLLFYFLFVVGITHVAYMGNIGPRYGVTYPTFLQFIAIGGGIGFFTSLVMFWNLQELIAGNVVSLSEKEFIFAALLI